MKDMALSTHCVEGTVSLPPLVNWPYPGAYV
jgi:hypothetical protein